MTWVQERAGGPGGAVELPRELVDALRDGPFHVALDLAIRHHRLSLESVQRRMSGQGARVSQATLSYWRRGGRQPEGERSLHAVHAVERSLGLPTDSLVRLIGPHRPRGRTVGALPGSYGVDVALEISPELVSAFDGIDIDNNLRMSAISVDQCTLIAANRTEQLVSSRIAVTSRVDGVDRWVCFFDPKAAGTGYLPTLRDTYACRPARVRTDPARDLLGVELRFDYPLRAGDTYVFGYDIGYAGRSPCCTFSQFGLRMPARQLVLEVRFEAGAVPVRCYRYQHGLRKDGTRPAEAELPLGSSLICHSLLLDVRPGVFGIRWEWD
jgi:hypothetical protein